MNFKSILVLGLSVATLGLSLPAHADEAAAGDTATVVNSTQNAITTGDFNTTNQSNKTRVTNSQTGRRNAGNTGTVVNSSQSADTLGNFNYTNQENQTKVRNSQQRR
jgi:endonuclease/exonuclease/phosphatase family metal-dependent hydrolase